MSETGTGIVERVRQLADPLATAAGMELVDVEYAREGGRWILRLYIDKPEGVSLDDCQELSRQVEKLLDVEEVIQSAYALEVSSPGLERPLKKRAHFEQFAGSDVEVKTFAPIGTPPRKNFKGRLLGIDPDDSIRIEIDGAQYLVPLAKVAKAHLAIDFEALAADLKGKKGN